MVAQRSFHPPYLAHEPLHYYETTLFVVIPERIARKVVKAFNDNDNDAGLVTIPIDYNNKKDNLFASTKSKPWWSQMTHCSFPELYSLP